MLGWGWSLLNPLATMLVFTLVFHFVLRIPPPHGAAGVTNYPLFLLCAMLPWNFMSVSLTTGIASVVGNANLIKKTYFPRELLVASTVCSAAVTFGIELVVLCAAFLAVGSVPFLWVPAALLYSLLVGVFAIGLALGLSVINVYFRDTTYLVGILLQIWFYATPVIYPITQLTSGHHDVIHRYHLVGVYRLNPMTDLVEGVRDAIYQHRFTEPLWLAYAAAVSVAVAAAGWAIFKRLEGRLAEEL